MKNSYSASDKTYAAAILDGEGWLYANRFKRKDNGHYCVQCRVGVANDSISMLEWLKKSFGGSIHRQGPDKKTHTWCLTKMVEMLWFLKIVRPYIKIKGIIADTMIEFLELRVDGIIDNHYSNKMSDKAIELVHRIKELNTTRSYL